MNKRVLALLAVCFAAVAVCSLASLAVAADDNPPTVDANAASTPPPTADKDYRIASEDVLRLDVWGEPQMSNIQMQVTPDGKVNMAYIGEMQAAGLTQDELTQAIVKKLADAGIIYDAKVQISILELHKPEVRVLGSVQRPGSFPFKDGDTVLDAVAQGGSYTPDAYLEGATLTHKGSDKSIPINLKKLLAGDTSQPNYKLERGDVIYIPPSDYKNKIYVLGQVNRPGLYDLKDNTTLLSALTLASGPTDRGSVRNTVIVRGDRSKPQRVSCNLSKLFDKGDLSQDVALQPGDVVIVPETKKPDWNKIAQIVGTIVNVSYIRRLGLF